MCESPTGRHSERRSWPIQFWPGFLHTCGGSWSRICTEERSDKTTTEGNLQPKYQRKKCPEYFRIGLNDPSPCPSAAVQSNQAAPYLPGPGVGSGHLTSHHSPLHGVILLQIPGLGLQLGQHWGKHRATEQSDRKRQAECERRRGTRRCLPRAAKEINTRNLSMSAVVWNFLYWRLLPTTLLYPLYVCVWVCVCVCPPVSVSPLSLQWIHLWKSWLSYGSIFFSTGNRLPSTQVICIYIQPNVCPEGLIYMCSRCPPLSPDPHFTVGLTTAQTNRPWHVPGLHLCCSNPLCILLRWRSSSQLLSGMKNFSCKDHIQLTFFWKLNVR